MTKLGIAELQDYVGQIFPQVAPLGLRVHRLDDDGIDVRQTVKPEHLRPGGTVSGPTLMGLADVAFYMLLLSRIGPVPLAVTTSLNINFLSKAGADKDLRAVARLLKLGKKLAVGEVSLFSGENQQPAAHVTMTYSIPQSA